MVDEKDRKFAIEHFRRRAEAQHRLASVADDLRSEKPDYDNRNERESRAKKMISAFQTMREAGRMTFPEFLCSAGFYALEIIHSHRLDDGDYDTEMEPINRQLRAVERAHGLTEGQFWYKDQGPEEWLELNRQWDAASQRQQLAVFRELGLADLANILETDSKRFHELWIQGIEAVDEYFPPRQRLEAMVNTYRQEAISAEAAGALHGAVALRGAVLEGILLLRCLDRKAAVEQALASLPPSERPRGPATNWTLNQLIRLSIAAGWLRVSDVEGETLDPSIYANLIADLRNMLHPGRRLKQPEIELTTEELADAKAALAVVELLLQGLDS